MSTSIYIQLKAALLLLVFGLNTIIGFACAVGVDMGFNTSHHHNNGTAEKGLEADDQIDVQWIELYQSR